MLAITESQSIIIKDLKNIIGYSLDKWQAEMVEHYRSGRDCLVRAPTSSGKTFIAYEIIR